MLFIILLFEFELSELLLIGLLNKYDFLLNAEQKELMEKAELLKPLERVLVKLNLFLPESEKVFNSPIILHLRSGRYSMES